MSPGTLQRYLAEELDGWDYDFSRFEISDFIAWVAARHGKPIHLVPWRLPPELFGAWVVNDSADFVFYEAGPLHVHTVHIILHELCHILLGHRTVHAGRELDALLADSGPRIEAQAALRSLLRQSATDEQELEAETLSTLIQQRVYQRAGIAALSHVSDVDAMRQFMQGLGMDEVK